MPPARGDEDVYQRCLDTLARSDLDSELDRRSAAIFVWIVLNGDGTFERINTGVSHVFGVASGVVHDGLVHLRASGLVRLTTHSCHSGGDGSSRFEWIERATLTPAGVRTALVVRPV